MQWSKFSRSFLVVLLKRSFSTFVNEKFVPFLLYLFRCSWPMCRLIILTASWFSASTAISYALFFSRLSSFRLMLPLSTNFNFFCFMIVSKRKGLTLVKLQSSPNLPIWRPNEANYRGPFHIQSSILHLLLLNFLYIQVGLILQLKCKLTSVFRNIQCII